MARCVRTADAARGGRTRGGGALSGGTPGRARCRENVRCAKTLESTSAPASSETGTYRLHLGHRDPGSTLSIRAEPLQDTRAPRSARDARRARLCASPASRRTRFPVARFAFSLNCLSLSLTTKNGPLGFKNALSRVSPLNETAPRSNAKLRRVAEARNLVKRTNARFVRVDRRDPRAAHEARAARTRPPVLFVSITGTFSGSPGERYVPPPPMRPIEPPIPVRRLPSLAPVCQRGN